MKQKNLCDTTGFTAHHHEVGVDIVWNRVIAKVGSSSKPQFVLLGIDKNARTDIVNRIKPAIKSAGYSFPANVTVQIDTDKSVPANEADYLDLSIAAAILAASGQISPQYVEENQFIGRLNIAGEVVPISDADMLFDHRGQQDFNLAVRAEGKPTALKNVLVDPLSVRRLTPDKPPVREHVVDIANPAFMQPNMNVPGKDPR